jgi:hypothetical protein
MSAGKMTDAEAVSLAGVSYMSPALFADGPALLGGRIALGVITIGVSVVLVWRVDARAHEAHQPLVSHDNRLSSSVGARVSRGTAHRFARSPGHVRAARLS